MAVQYPEQKYYESAHGVLAAAPQAKELRFFIRTFIEKTKDRVFIHPSSLNFSAVRGDEDEDSRLTVGLYLYIYIYKYIHMLHQRKWSNVGTQDIDRQPLCVLDRLFS
jgi:hypothetical protein